MQHVAANFEEAKKLGKQASEYIRQTLSWENSAEIILERLAALKTKPILRNGDADSGKTPIPKSQPHSGDIDQSFVREAIPRIGDETEIKAEQYLYIANQYKELGELERALVNYKRALDAKPDYLDALKSYAETLLQIGQAEEAAEIFQKAEKLHSNTLSLENK